MLFSLLFACVPELTSPDDSGASSCWMEADNQWSSHIPNDIKGEGFGLGQVPHDMCMLDQHGDMVSLWQFYGEVILLDISAEWCAPCQELADGVEETWKDFEDQGFIYITLLTEDNFSEIPEQEVLLDWATSHNITAPVLSDSENYKQQLVPDGAYPRLMLIDRTMTVQIDKINPATEEVIHQTVQDAM
jgi:thiol-disulfide isomerase/thioredoxin